MALVSGLGVAEGGTDDPLRLALMVDWLSGMLGGPLDQQKAAQVQLTNKILYMSFQKSKDINRMRQ